MYVLGSCFHHTTLFTLYWAITAIYRNHVPHHYQPSASTKWGHESSQIVILSQKLGVIYLRWRGLKIPSPDLMLFLWYKCTMFLFLLDPSSSFLEMSCAMRWVFVALIAPAAAIWLLSRAISRQRQLISIAIRRCRRFHQSPTPWEDDETLIFNASNSIDFDDEIPARPHMMRVISLIDRIL